MTDQAQVAKIVPVSGNPYLKARVDIAFPSGLIIHGISVFRRQDGELSVGLPNAPMVGQDGKALVDDRGKRRYTPTISFATGTAQDRWRSEVLAAIKRLPPDAIDR
jgi:hypothetical protein